MGTVNGFVYVYYNGTEQPELRQTRPLISGGSYTPSAHIPAHDSGMVLQRIALYSIADGTVTDCTVGAVTVPEGNVTLDYFFTGNGGADSDPNQPPAAKGLRLRLPGGWQRVTPYVFTGGAWHRAEAKLYSGGWK